MKAIIIEDKDAKALLAQLELEKFNTVHLRKDPDRPVSRDEMHRWFHYVVVNWLQEQGAEIV